jgi:small-conductance mechanosensitive channel
LKSYAYLFEGLTVRRVLVVTVICAVAAAMVVRTFLNTYPDLLVSALCVGYTSMLLFTLGGNLRQSRLPREVVQVGAIVVGSFVGTVLAGLVKGRDIRHMFSERLEGVSITMGLGIGFGCVVVAWYILREKHARERERMLRAEADRHQLEKNVLEARLALMQAQVEPHFLFNTLANVQHLSRPIRRRRRAFWTASSSTCGPRCRRCANPRRTSGASSRWRARSSRSTACAWARASSSPSRCRRR